MPGGGGSKRPRSKFGCSFIEEGEKKSRTSAMVTFLTSPAFVGWASLIYPRLLVVSHLLVCLTTDPKPFPKQAVHIMRSRASSFRYEYPVLSLRSSSNFLHHLPRLSFTSIHSFVFLSITCLSRQFRRRM
jgi:hypothetical protein